MKSLRVRFAIGFSFLFTVFLAIALLIVYMSYADFRKEEFYHRLKDRALTTFKFLIEVDQIDYDLLQVIDKNTLNNLYDEKVVILEGNQLLYSSTGSKNIKYDARLLQQVKQEKELNTTQGDDEVLALYVQQNGKEYTILAEAFDKYGRRKMTFLKWVVIIVYCSGIVVGWVATYFFVKRVISPLEGLKKDIQNINSSSLNTRLRQSGQGEEVDNLATNFNQMLERLQQSFSIQKNFVHYASHELRTPLTAMIAITENGLRKQLQPAQYPPLLEQIYQQQQYLTDITNSLLLLSDHQIVSEQEYPRVRLDELIFRSVEITQTLFPQASIEVDLEGAPLTEESLMVYANEPLLLMAFNNLLKNALQYSHNSQAFVTVRFLENTKEVEFRNAGKPLSAEEQQMIFTPFYRAGNATVIKGHGLGLPLVKQIAELHKGAVQFYRDGAYNVFRFSLP